MGYSGEPILHLISVYKATKRSIFDNGAVVLISTNQEPPLENAVSLEALAGTPLLELRITQLSKQFVVEYRGGRCSRIGETLDSLKPIQGNHHIFFHYEIGQSAFASLAFRYAP